MGKAKLKEISITTSVGGKIQIVKYQFSADYFASFGQKYDVEDMSDEEAEKFRQEKWKELRAHIEKVGQKEIDQLTELRDQMSEQ